MVVVLGGRCRVRRAGVIDVVLVEMVATAHSFVPPILAYLALGTPAAAIAVAAIAASSSTAVVLTDVLADPLTAVLMAALAGVVLAALATISLRWVAPLAGSPAPAVCIHQRGVL